MHLYILLNYDFIELDANISYKNTSYNKTKSFHNSIINIDFM